MATGRPEPIALKLAGGVGPLTVLVNGLPLEAPSGRRTLFFEPEGPGFVRLTVIDATRRDRQRAGAAAVTGIGAHSTRAQLRAAVRGRTISLLSALQSQTGSGHGRCGRQRGRQAMAARGLTEDRRLRVALACARVAVLLVVALLSFLPGFFAIPPTDRDEARFAQATKQMVETGDYVDIRFQDEVRYKKPVGIYWLQAGVVKTAQALGVPEALHHDLALSHSLAARRDRRGAADLLGGARVRLAPRRAARRPDDGELRSCSASRRGIAKTDAMPAAHRGRRHGRDGARLSARAARAARRGAAAWTVPAIFWTALAASACCSRGR